MRYFMIYADKKNPQPRFMDWYTQMRPGRTDSQIYEELSRQNHFQIELNREITFMDLICHPCFMVSKEFAALIRVYSPEIQFKYVTLNDKENRRSAFYQIPDLPQLDCLDEKSEISRDGSIIIKGVLKKEKIQTHSIFRLGGIKGRYIVADLKFVESACRREVMGMRIEEIVVK